MCLSIQHSRQMQAFKEYRHMHRDYFSSNKHNDNEDHAAGKLSQTGWTLPLSRISRCHHTAASAADHTCHPVMQQTLSLLLAYLQIRCCLFVLFAVPAYEVYVQAGIMTNESGACKWCATVCENTVQTCFASCA